MTSLFKSLIKDSRETAIKELLISTLSENVREIQYECKESGKDNIELTDSTNSLCTTLESIFLHGLKDSFVWQAINVLSGDVDRRPEPNFWPILLVFLHKQVIEHIQSLSQITTDIGYCRSWIRLSLNESLLSSYLNNIKKNLSALNPYYKKFAFLRDSDNIDVASKILEGFETCIQINLPINSSLLNNWTNLTLQLAGIWTPPLKTCPIASGIDVASSITNAVTIPTPKPLQTNELFSESISNSPFNTSILDSSDNDNEKSDLNDSENIKILLQKVDEIGKVPDDDDDDDDKKEKQKNNEINDSTTVNKVRDKNRKIKKHDKNRLSLNIDNQNQKKSIKNTTPIGNSVMNISGWSTNNEDDNTEENDNNLMNTSTTSQNTGIINCDASITSESMTTTTTTTAEHKTSNIISRSNSMNMSTSSLKSPLDRHSYNTLLVRHEKTRQLDWNDVWARFEGNVGVSGDIILGAINESNNDNSVTEDIVEDEIKQQNLGFEIIPQTLSEKFTLHELQSMVEQMFQLAHEKGLDSQGFICKTCPQPLGVGFAPVQVCAFSGNYFCNSCISVEPQLIPSKIIYNWDFHKYTISKRAALFLNEFQNQPFIDLKLLNPDIYMVSGEMATLQSLRIKLNFIRAYLFTCRESIIDDLQKQVWPKEYLYEHIHQYSIADLSMIQKGTLAQLLQKTVQFGENHILNCRLCSVKGFICEVCDSPKVLYPFHIETTFRCELCGAVFHANCLDDSQPCPKCERKRRREDLPLLEAVDML